MTRLLFFIIFFFIIKGALAQIAIPLLPFYDSAKFHSSGKEIYKKEYFYKKVLVAEVTYNDGIAGASFGPTIHFSGQDSCLALFKNKNYDAYYFSKQYIINHQFSEYSNIFRHQVILKQSHQIIEKGTYFITTDITNGHHSKASRPRYKIGKWHLFDSLGKQIQEIDYDNMTLNGSKINLSDLSNSIPHLKKKTDSLINQTFGLRLTRKHIKFNLDKSSYGSNVAFMSPVQPSGRKIFPSSNPKIEYMDMCYDIVINDTLRFDAIMIRILKDGTVLDRRNFKNYGADFDLCIGLDPTLKKKIKIKPDELRVTALNNKLNFYGDDFYMYMQWERIDGIMGKLHLVMEQEINHTTLGGTTFINYKQVHLDPANGKSEVKVNTIETFRQQ